MGLGGFVVATWRVAPPVFRAPRGVLLGRAALCAPGRRPAREIATREPDGSEWSISRPALALPLPTGTAARPSGPSGALHTGGARSLMCALRVDSLSGQAPPPPTGTAARPSIPPAPSTPVGPGVLACGSARRLEARPGPEAVSAISHVIPLRIFQTMNSYRWGFNVSGPCCNFVQSNYVRLFWEW